jgi:hypothetical protein
MRCGCGAPESDREDGVTKSNLVLIAFALIGGLVLVLEHRAHLFDWLPFVLIAACPLLHLFHGHGGHGGHAGHRDRTPGDDGNKP